MFDIVAIPPGYTNRLRTSGSLKIKMKILKCRIFNLAQEYYILWVSSNVHLAEMYCSCKS